LCERTFEYTKADSLGLLYKDSRSEIGRINGSSDQNVWIVTSGGGVSPVGTTPVTVQGMCSTLDSQQTRLVMFVNGVQVTDTTEGSTDLPSDAWIGEIDVASDANGETATLTHYEERDLSR
jgi:hypothetical protein